MSHNSIEWHTEIIKKIKKKDKEKLVLVDIPGDKPRTLNKKIIKIKNGEIIKFILNQILKM